MLLPMPICVLIAREFVPSAAFETECFEMLPVQRQASLARMPDPAARRRSLLGNRLLWHGLQGLGFGHGALASLRYADDGRPSLDLPVHFSLSHAGALLLCAISSEGPVGVDVEPLGALTAEGFARYLDDGERAWAGHDAARFHAIWTGKEAVVKAAGGRGLRDVPRVAMQEGGRFARLDGHWWQTQPIAVGEDHVACLAYPAACADAESGRHRSPDVRIVLVARDALESGPAVRPTGPGSG